MLYNFIKKLLITSIILIPLNGTLQAMPRPESSTLEDRTPSPLTNNYVGQKYMQPNSHSNSKDAQEKPALFNGWYFDSTSSEFKKIAQLKLKTKKALKKTLVKELDSYQQVWDSEKIYNAVKATIIKAITLQIFRRYQDAHSQKVVNYDIAVIYTAIYNQVKQYIEKKEQSKC